MLYDPITTEEFKEMWLEHLTKSNMYIEYKDFTGAKIFSDPTHVKTLSRATFNTCRFDSEALVGSPIYYVWRYEGCTFEHCDFSGIDLDRADFVNCTFDGCNFEGTSFKGCNIEACTFDRCILSKSDWLGARIISIEIEYLNHLNDYNLYILGKDTRNYLFYMAGNEDGVVTIFAGCRVFTGIKQAKDHWKNRQLTDNIKAQALGFVAMAKKVAPALGWRLEERQ